MREGAHNHPTYLATNIVIMAPWEALFQESLDAAVALALDQIALGTSALCMPSNAKAIASTSTPRERLLHFVNVDALGACSDVVALHFATRSESPFTWDSAVCLLGLLSKALISNGGKLTRLPGPLILSEDPVVAEPS